MIQFTPGSQHSVTVTCKNQAGVPFTYGVSLCMGTGWTVMATASFQLNAQESKAIGFPVTMPTTLGTYPVYFKVTCGGVLIDTFAAEDITIMVPIVFSNISVGEIYTIPDPILGDVQMVSMGATVKAAHRVPETPGVASGFFQVVLEVWDARGGYNSLSFTDVLGYREYVTDPATGELVGSFYYFPAGTFGWARSAMFPTGMPYASKPIYRPATLSYRITIKSYSGSTLVSENVGTGITNYP